MKEEQKKELSDLAMKDWERYQRIQKIQVQKLRKMNEAQQQKAEEKLLKEQLGEVWDELC